ncbi:hypothetical protein A1sIIB106_00215 [Candidatus Planktophila lacus]|uniref:hypothetical protein n=1 Tax=Candidatus Planktophila lacus TaxID=1884913 RepID=UPI000BACB06A|nr:hypothetical protein [Candidatus Planktophila lacus]ASY24511.1 hypothetical protein A1sIIB106_00215 [Candidatus Planktophila lacus]
MKFNNCEDSELELCTKPIVAFVHLGNNPASTLTWYASEVDKNLSNKHLCLITDNPKEFLDFPGEILIYDRSEINKGLSRFSKTNSAFKKLSGGYWKYTTERLFALSALSSCFSDSHPVIHLESDVLLLAKDDQVRNVLVKVKKTSVVRYSDSDGIASILIAPTISNLIQSLNALGIILLNDRHIFSDMELLGKALNQGALNELPNSPIEAWPIDSEKSYSIFFDGAFFGQYLFGLDPVHSQQYSFNGYKNPNCAYPLSKSIWALLEPSEYEGLSLAILENNHISFPLCLHVHSKMLIEYPKINEVFWRKLISDINAQIFSLKVPVHGSQIHSSNIKIQHRMFIFLYKRIQNLKKGLFS